MPEQSGRIAILSHCHPSLSKGGAEISAYTLFRGLRSLGEDPIFIAAVPSRERNRVELGTDREFVIPYDPQRYAPFYHLAPPEIPDAVEEIVRREGCTTANFHHFMNFGVNSVQRLATAGVRCFVTLHEFLAICHHHGQMVKRPGRGLCHRAGEADCAVCFPEHAPEQFRQRRDLFRRTFRDVAGFVSPSRFLRRRFAEWGLPEERIAVVENGLPHPPAHEEPRRRRGETWTFGYFGQITPFKGVDVLLAAAEQVGRTGKLAGQVSFRVHGNLVDPAAEFTRVFEAAVADGTVDYAGPYHNDDVIRLMQDCDYVIVPSLWWENSPVVIQEAYAAGRPVIAGHVGGMAEKVTDGQSGLHFRLGRPADLARTLELAANEPTWTRLRKGIPRPPNAREMAERYLEVFGMGRVEEMGERRAGTG